MFFLFVAQVAASRGHSAIIAALIDKAGADVNTKHKFAGNTALHFAAELNQAEAVTELCKRNADINSLTSTGSTPLHTASHTGVEVETITALIQSCNADHRALMVLNP